MLQISLFSVEVTKKEGEIQLILAKAIEEPMNKETLSRPETSLSKAWVALMLKAKGTLLLLAKVTTRLESVLLKPKRKKWICIKTFQFLTEVTNKAEEKLLTPDKVTEELMNNTIA